MRLLPARWFFLFAAALPAFAEGIKQVKPGHPGNVRWSGAVRPVQRWQPAIRVNRSFAPTTVTLQPTRLAAPPVVRAATTATSARPMVTDREATTTPSAVPRKIAASPVVTSPTMQSRLPRP